MIPISDENPAKLTPVITWGLIALCVVVFIWQLTVSESVEEQILDSYGFVPVAFFKPSGEMHVAGVPLPWISLFTSMFLHGGFLHLGGNMLYLWIFGNNVEDAMGHARYLFFYLVCGLAAALTQAGMDPQSTVPMIGASGAISGVLACYALTFPRARVNVIIPLGIIFYPVKISAVYVIGFWFLLQLISVALAPGMMGGGTAFGAHVGGFIVGLALTPVLSKFPLFGRPPPGPWG